MGQPIVYLDNMMMVEQYKVESGAIPAGKHQILIASQHDRKKPMSSGVVTVTVDGQKVAKTKIGRTVPAAFTAGESVDAGADPGSTVSLADGERRAFAFSGKINSMTIDLK